jgi:hypothetical protein
MAYPDGNGLALKKIDGVRAEILATTESVGGLEDLGRRLAAEHQEYAAHLRNGAEVGTIGQSHLEDRIRLLMAYAPDQEFWQMLSRRIKQLTLQEQAAKGPFGSEWSYLEDDLASIGEAFGWTSGASQDLSRTTFSDRLRMVNSTFAGIPTAQATLLYNSLGQEEGAPSATKSGGCFVATAVYGSYDAPEVRVLRRWRDSSLRSALPGQIFVRVYYTCSPHLLRIVGAQPWFTVPSRLFLDRLVCRLRRSGYSEEPYVDPPS